jgi:hypothetical protein
MKKEIATNDRADSVMIMKAFLDETTALAVTLKKKNDDYENSIFKTGTFGIMARIFDKMQRIQTIVSTGQVSVDNEPIEDTFQDLAGYSILGLLALKQHPAFFRKDGTVRGTSGDDWKDSNWVRAIDRLINMNQCKECNTHYSRDYDECPRCRMESQTITPVESNVELDVELLEYMEKHQ